MPTKTLLAVGKLRLDPVATGRITDAVRVPLRVDPAVAATVGKGGKMVTADAPKFPANLVNYRSFRFPHSAGFLEACLVNTPDTHPRATDIHISTSSTIRTGMITKIPMQFLTTELPGHLYHLPMASSASRLTTAANQCCSAQASTASEHGALQTSRVIRPRLLPDIIGATLGVQASQGLKFEIPHNEAISTDSCLKRTADAPTAVSRSWLRRTATRQPPPTAAKVPQGSAMDHSMMHGTSTWH
ncbi:hypothetical protein FB451DRAFT_1399618 [Mycena latifolia]|nr:hypothetical protein FB451DRAFT_1399618 [Mycena latifolia]